jgi:hypothetical protein
MDWKPANLSGFVLVDIFKGCDGVINNDHWESNSVPVSFDLYIILL